MKFRKIRLIIFTLDNDSPLIRKSANFIAPLPNPTYIWIHDDQWAIFDIHNSSAIPSMCNLEFEPTWHFPSTDKPEEDNVGIHADQLL
jgi:hypothetical protein